jgi:ankyrin repeat protein
MRTALHYAVLYGHVAVVERLLQAATAAAAAATAATAAPATVGADEQRETDQARLKGKIREAVAALEAVHISGEGDAAALGRRVQELRAELRVDKVTPDLVSGTGDLQSGGLLTDSRPLDDLEYASQLDASVGGTHAAKAVKAFVRARDGNDAGFTALDYAALNPAGRGAELVQLLLAAAELPAPEKSRAALIAEGRGHLALAAQLRAGQLVEMAATVGGVCRELDLPAALEESLRRCEVTEVEELRSLVGLGLSASDRAELGLADEDAERLLEWHWWRSIGD